MTEHVFIKPYKPSLIQMYQWALSSKYRIKKLKKGSICVFCLDAGLDEDRRFNCVRCKLDKL